MGLISATVASTSPSTSSSARRPVFPGSTLWVNSITPGSSSCAPITSPSSSSRAIWVEAGFPTTNPFAVKMLAADGVLVPTQRTSPSVSTTTTDSIAGLRAK